MRASLRNIRAVAGVTILELYRRRDMYVALVLALVTVAPLAAVGVFGVQGVVRYLREVSLLLIWLFSIVIGIGTAARQIPVELESRTIYPLLAKPIQRWEFVVGKYVGATLATASALVLFYVLFVVLSGLKAGVWVTPTLAQALVLHLGFVGLLTACVLLGSVILTPSANVTTAALLAGGMLLFGEKLVTAASSAPAPASWFLRLFHWVAPHFEFFDMRLRVVHEWEPIPGGVLAVVLVYALLYSAVLVGVAVLAFGRRRL